MRKFNLWMSLLAIVVLSLPATSLIAQNDNTRAARDRSVKAIQSLKNGVLIVRIPSKQNKIDELQRLAQSSDLTNKERERMRANYTQTLAERNAYAQELMAAFEAHYSFSKVYFAYDTAFVHLSKGQTAGLFLDKNLETDTEISIADQPYLVLRTGTTNPSYTSGIEAMVFMDQTLEDLNKPFPYYVKMKTIGHIIQSIFYPRKATRRSAVKMVTQINKNLYKYGKSVGTTAAIP